MGDEGRLMGGTGDFMTIDRGSDHGVTHGQRFSVYRDKGPAAGPLVEVGVLEAVQIRAESSTVRVIAAARRGHDQRPRGDSAVGLSGRRGRAGRAPRRSWRSLALPFLTNSR